MLRGVLAPLAKNIDIKPTGSFCHVNLGQAEFYSAKFLRVGA